MLTRRKFLQLLALLGASSAAHQVLKKPLPKVAAQDAQSVIVVGAGAAGVAAAWMLHDAGHRVIVLEAENRIGGRIWTDTSLGVPLDLGASWIHGVEDNPVTELVEEEGLATAETDYDNHFVYDFDGRELSDAEIDAIESRFEDVLEGVDDAWDDFDENTSLGEAVASVLAAQTMSVDEARYLAYALNATIEHEYAADVSALSLFHGDEGDEFGGEDVIFPGGYIQVLQGLVESLDLRLGQVVERIEYGADGVRVTANGTVFEADRAIITLPLGVLKNNVVEFSPPLNERKQSAIARIGMGVLNKTYLRFPHVFWDEEADLIGYAASKKGYWAEWLNIFKYTGQPILLGFNAGTFGLEIESLSDDEIVAQAMGVLRTLYGEGIPEPDGHLITRWGSNPRSFGAYSSLAPGSSPDDRAALAEPIDGRLLFAGEATSVDYPSTVHGALLSGYRAAEEIADQ